MTSDAAATASESDPQNDDGGGGKTKGRSRCSDARTRPYPKEDNLPSINKLSMAEDSCLNKRCRCNLKKASEDDSTDTNSLNFARACAASKTTRKYIQDAHFKLHNRKKDTRQLIKAARLKVMKISAPVSTPAAVTKTSSGSRSQEGPQDMFGKGLVENVKDFAALVAEDKAKKMLKQKDAERGEKDCPEESKENRSSPSKDGLTFEEASFASYRPVPAVDVTFRGPCIRVMQPTLTTSPRVPQTDESSLSLRDLEAGLPEVSSDSESTVLSASAGATALPETHCPLHPGRCKRPCTCSDQARLGDLSVEELAYYFEDFVYIPRKMSRMAEMMYT